MILTDRPTYITIKIFVLKKMYIPDPKIKRVTRINVNGFFKELHSKKNVMIK